jgi:uncharacterized lipoprotein YajG
MALMRHMLRFVAILVLAVATAGCALTTDEVDLAYTSAAPSNVENSAEAIVVQVVGTEGRVTKADRISVKKNGYGMEMAPIVARQNIPDLVRSALEIELQRLGFRIGTSPVRTSVEVQRFYNDFKIGFFSGNAVGEVALGVQVLGRDNHILYSRSIVAESDVGGIMLANGSNAKTAVEQALGIATARLVGDPNFIRALIQAGKEGSRMS